MPIGSGENAFDLTSDSGQVRTSAPFPPLVKVRGNGMPLLNTQAPFPVACQMARHTGAVGPVVQAVRSDRGI